MDESYRSLVLVIEKIIRYCLKQRRRPDDRAMWPTESSDMRSGNPGDVRVA